LNSLKLWTKEVKLKDVILRHGDDGRNIKARIRHRAPLVNADYRDGLLTFKDEQKSLTPGQSIVFYRDEVCLGGGIIV
jgi:tRNA-specific 2-thiouridylase